jgi:hypothetical protein
MLHGVFIILLSFCHGCSSFCVCLHFSFSSSVHVLSVRRISFVVLVLYIQIFICLCLTNLFLLCAHLKSLLCLRKESRSLGSCFFFFSGHWCCAVKALVISLSLYIYLFLVV